MSVHAIAELNFDSRPSESGSDHLIAEHCSAARRISLIDWISDTLYNDTLICRVW